MLVVCGLILLQTFDSVTVPAEDLAPFYLVKVLHHMYLLSILLHHPSQNFKLNLQSHR